MKILAFIFLITFVLSQGVETFTIDLDGDPLTRYNEPNKEFYNITASGMKMILSYIPKELHEVISVLYYNVVKKIYPDLSLELVGISKYFGIPEYQIYLYQLVYDIVASCTSIVATSYDGTVIHGRNFDYLIPELLKKAQYLAIYKKKNKEEFRCIATSGITGLLTCMKTGKFAISVNERDDDSGNGLKKTIQAVKNGKIITLWAVRRAVEAANTYDELVKMLQEIKICSTVYFIVSGVKRNEGIVITRDRTFALDSWKLSDNEWFLVQVNTDRWRQIPTNETDRRTPAINRLKEIGRYNINTELMFNKVMKLYPNNNKDTIFYSVMCAKTGLMKVEIS